LPNWSGFTLFGTALGGIFTAARSLDWSLPSTCACTEEPFWPNLTSTVLLPPTTWELVTRVPLRSMRKPVPDPLLVLIDTTAGLA
jgi:hypothetical protein